MRFNSTQYASSQDSIRAIYVPVPVCFLAEESHWLSSNKQDSKEQKPRKLIRDGFAPGGVCGVVAIKIEHDILVSDQANL